MIMATKKKKKSLKPIVWDTAFFIGGLVFGQLIASLVRNIGFLRWLSFEVAFGILDPITIDLSLVKFNFGFGFYLTPAVVLFSMLFLVGGKLLRQQLTPAKTRPSVTAEIAANQENSDTNEQYYDA